MPDGRTSVYIFLYAFSFFVVKFLVLPFIFNQISATTYHHNGIWPLSGTSPVLTDQEQTELLHLCFKRKVNVIKADSGVHRIF